jgi:hypothetical protein
MFTRKKALLRVAVLWWCGSSLASRKIASPGQQRTLERRVRNDITEKGQLSSFLMKTLNGSEAGRYDFDILSAIQHGVMVRRCQWRDGAI